MNSSPAFIPATMVAPSLVAADGPREPTTATGSRWWNRRSKAIIVGAMLLLYVVHLSPTWKVSSDSALYLVLARNLAAGDGYTFGGQPHGMVPPGFPFVISLLMRAGLGGELALNVFMVLTCFLALWLAYELVKQLATPRIAFAVVLILGFSWQMHLNTIRVQPDVPALALVCGGLWMCLRGLNRGGAWLESGCVLIVISCWFRIPCVPIAIMTAPALLFQQRKSSFARTVTSAVALLCMLGATLIFFQSRYEAARANPYANTYKKHVRQLTTIMQPSGLEGVVHSSQQVATNAYSAAGVFTELATGYGVYHFANRWCGEAAVSAISAIAIWPAMLYGLFLLARKRQWAPVLLIVGYGGFICLHGSRSPRYWLPLAPLVVMTVLVGFQGLAAKLCTTGSVWNRLAPALAALLVLFNLPNIVFSAWCLHFDVPLPMSPQRASQRIVAAFLAEDMPANAHFIGHNFREISYLSGRSALPAYGVWLIPDPEFEANLGGVLDRNEVTHFVRNRRHRIPAPMERALNSDPRIERAYQDEHFVVYALRQPPHVARKTDN
jgi:hypothetical protein